MQTHSTALHHSVKSQIGVTVLCAVLTACGGGGSDAPPAPQTIPEPPAPTVPQQRAAALRLFESPYVHRSLTASPLVHASSGGYDVYGSGPCASVVGSRQTSLNGSSVTSRTDLPLGAHTLVVSFNNCVVDGLVGTSLNGTVNAEFTRGDSTNLSAVFSTASMRGFALSFRSDLGGDVTAVGSGTLQRSSTSAWETDAYSPGIGSKLTNNLTTNVATFRGGTWVEKRPNPLPSGAAGAVQAEFYNLTVDVNSTVYILNGTLLTTFGFGNQQSNLGEVRITSNGSLVARIYGATDGVLTVEVLSPLIPL